MDFVNHVSVEDMRREIIEQYGPTIHNTFVNDMPAGRVARIYIQMKKIGPSDPSHVYRREAVKAVLIKRRRKIYVVDGQMSLFD